MFQGRLPDWKPRWYIFLIFFLFTISSVADVVPPVFLSCPSDISANLGINSSLLVNWTIPVAVDSSNMAPQISVSPPGVAPPYTFYNNTNVVYTAKDPSGNEGKCSFRVLSEGAYIIIERHLTRFHSVS